MSISDERLAKLKAVSETGLRDLAEEMKRLKMAGYQGSLLKVMAEDLRMSL